MWSILTQMTKRTKNVIKPYFNEPKPDNVEQGPQIQILYVRQLNA